jgi:hypothetical protein
MCYKRLETGKIGRQPTFAARDVPAKPLSRWTAPLWNRACKAFYGVSLQWARGAVSLRAPSDYRQYIMRTAQSGVGIPAPACALLVTCLSPSRCLLAAAQPR